MPYAKRQVPNRDRVRLAIVRPDYGHGQPDSHRLFWSGGIKQGSRLVGKVLQDQFRISFGSGNIFFATAMNAQEFDGLDITHLFSMHNDVVPEVGYLDILMDEMERTGADFLSVLLPIKDLHGLSSTAIDSLDDPYCVERRITMDEAYRLPETFDSADCGYPDRALLVNTGCWLMNWTKDWRKLVNPDGSLAINCTSPDRIKRRPPDPSKCVSATIEHLGRQGTVLSIIGGDNEPKSVNLKWLDDNTIELIPLNALTLAGPAKEAVIGRWEAQHSPADWYLSRHLHNCGAKVMCTRKVKAVHVGEMPWTNMQPWGDWKIDEALKHKFGGVPISGVRHGNEQQVSGSDNGCTVQDALSVGDTSGEGSRILTSV